MFNDYILALFAGFVQGITEFLPISSSGHLVLIHDIFGLAVSDEVAFDVLLHVATLMALLAFFWRDIVAIMIAWFKSLRMPLTTWNEQHRLAWAIVLGCIPAGIVGLLFENGIESAFRNPASVAFMLIAIGVLLWFADRHSVHRRDMRTVTIRDGLVIGCAQALALVPGVSRSGITIIAALFLGYLRPDAARFSFLLSAPIIAAAGAKKVYDAFIVGGAQVTTIEVLGFLTAAITGFFCIGFFLRYLQRATLTVFAYYRIVLGALILLTLWL